MDKQIVTPFILEKENGESEVFFPEREPEKIPEFYAYLARKHEQKAKEYWEKYKEVMEILESK